MEWHYQRFLPPALEPNGAAHMSHSEAEWQLALDVTIYESFWT